MDAELYTVWDAVLFYLLYFRHLVFGLFLILDVFLFTRWKTTSAVRLPAVFLAFLLVGGVLWWFFPVLL